ncbi:MAG TPA: sulfate ABC transporter ATP-binding protein [Geminicoccaceae bacterium]|mgnify:CR=1 FL=1|nr:sulfate ABC transporter ATP-binding protein [Geminicoccus sp.]HMU51464.1 sulfate ABC transporter ATP-binding protein [Geminicoccaceae bacterium]
MTIEVRNLVRRFDGFTALGGVDLRIEPGELVALLGPSGSGKTTLLRIIAGLDFPTEGEVLFDGEDATDRHVGARGIGFVFQHYALFRHMTVADNVAFGLRVRPRRQRLSPGAIHERVTGLLRLVQLEGFAHRYPSQLSGGQRQRVALARALAIQPRVLLLDEPFGALDAKVRKELRRWLRQLHDEMGLTSLFVTHDQEEAMELADRVVVMRNGGIEQIGSPDSVYEHPATPFVYEFLGQVNRLPVSVSRGRARLWNQDVPVDLPRLDALGPAIAYVRPEDIELSPRAAADSVQARVEHIAAFGPVVRVELSVPGATELLTAEMPRSRLRELHLHTGVHTHLRVRTARVFGDGQQVAA